MRALDRQSESLQSLSARCAAATGPRSRPRPALRRLEPRLPAPPRVELGVRLLPDPSGGYHPRAGARAEANAQATLAQLEAQRLQIRVDVQQAALSLHAAKASQAATERAAVNAREQLRLAEGRFAQGVGNAIDSATRR